MNIIQRFLTCFKESRQTQPETYLKENGLNLKEIKAYAKKLYNN